MTRPSKENTNAAISADRRNKKINKKKRARERSRPAQAGPSRNESVNWIFRSDPYMYAETAATPSDSAAV